MPATSYDYLISDFPSGLNVDGFVIDIRDSSIVVALDHVAVESPDVHIWFKDALSSGDALTLNALVNAHSGQAPPGSSGLTVLINEASNRTITGVQTWDRSGGGVLIPPAGTVFPASPSAGELFWKVDEATLYRRNEGNTGWVSITATTSGSKAGTINPGSFSGNPKEASVSFGAPFGSTSYAVVLSPRTDGSRTFSPSLLTKTTGGFTVSLNANNIAGLVELGWVCTVSGG